MTTYYKITDEDGRPVHGGTGQWPLPKDGKPGRWRSVKGELIPCQNGLHVTTAEHLLTWAGPVLWEVEVGTERIDHGDKTVVRRARLLRRVETWNQRTLRLFAADCAERVLPLFESRFPDDKRPRLAIEVARRMADGAPYDSAASSAASSAGRSAASSAGRSAAYSAARSAARSAAYSAARSSDAAYFAADSAADSVARYSAADSVARSAAYSAARSSAAYFATYSAAYSAARERQTDRLIEMLGLPHGK